MTSDLYFTTGRRARQPASSPSPRGQIRNVCQTGAIAAELTLGGQWRIPKTERDRLKGDGMPAVDRPLPDYDPHPAKPRDG